MPDEQRRTDTDQDIEGDAPDRRPSNNTDTENDEKDEYLKLVKYVSTYRESDPGEDEGEGEVREQRLWYAPWRKRKIRVKKIDTGTYPDEWLTTDIHQGLSTSDIETRRKRAGFNELAAEKENLVAKFMSYFRGPILYGMIIPTFPLRTLV